LLRNFRRRHGQAQARPQDIINRTSRKPVHFVRSFPCNQMYGVRKAAGKRRPDPSPGCAARETESPKFRGRGRSTAFGNHSYEGQWSWVVRYSVAGADSFRLGFWSLSRARRKNFSNSATSGARKSVPEIGRLPRWNLNLGEPGRRLKFASSTGGVCAHRAPG